MIENTATADSDQTDAVTNSTSTPVSQIPAIEVTKIVVSDNGADEAGDVIDYSIFIQNDGNQTLTDIQIEDALTNLTQTLPSLAPGADQTITTSYTLTQNDLDTNAGGAGHVNTVVDTQQTSPVSASHDNT